MLVYLNGETPQLFRYVSFVVKPFVDWLWGISPIGVGRCGPHTSARQPGIVGGLDSLRCLAYNLPNLERILGSSVRKPGGLNSRRAFAVNALSHSHSTHHTPARRNGCQDRSEVLHLETRPSTHRT